MPMLSPKEAYLRAQEAFAQGRYRSAVTMTESLYRQLPHHPPAVVLHIATLLRLQHAQQAAQIAQKSLRSITHHGHRTLILTSLSEAMNQMQSFDEAIGLLQTELSARPDDPFLIAALAQLLVIQNRHDEALALTDAAMARGLTHLGVAVGFARGALRTDRRDEAIKHIQSALAAPDADKIPDATRSSAYTMLGHLQDKAGDYDAAFDAYTKRNRLYPETYNDLKVQHRCAQLTETWTPESFVGVKRPSPADVRPVFIVGMPRSGSTLTEQILDAHPDVFGAGELELMNELVHDAAPSTATMFTTPPADYSPAKIREIAKFYCDELIRRSAPNRSPVVVDKALGSFWHMGFIALAFPNAKIIHCQRDPRDTCLSCYFQALDPSHSFSFDLANSGRYYRHYHSFTKHMSKVLRDPRVGVDVLEMHYEDTVADLEAQTRRLLDFVGLDFHEDCLNFHQSKRIAMTLSNDQVRKPIYSSSTKRYERYAKHTAPLLKALGDLLPDAHHADT